MLRVFTASLIALLVVRGGVAQDTKPEDEFRKALQLQNEQQLEKACRALVTIGTVPMAKLILGSTTIKGLETDVYWILIRACAAFGNTDALNEVAAHILSHKGQPVSRDLAMALHNNFNASVEGAMIRLVTDGNEELRILALDHLADVGQKETCTTIVAILKKEGDKPASTEVRRRMFLVLAALTGQDYGDSISNWTGWWDANSSKPWDQLKKSGEKKGGEFGFTRTADLEETKNHKVLLIHAGSACRCGSNHDLDGNMSRAITGMELQLDTVTKDKWESGGKLDSGEAFKPEDYIAIVVMCTQIYEHCANGKPTAQKGGNRMNICGCPKHDPVRFMMGKKGVEKLKKYVEAGGYLFTEDWALEEVLAVAWPDIVKVGARLKEQDVAVLPKPGSGSHPYLRKIFVKPPSKAEGNGTKVEEDVSQINHKWHIDDESPWIKIVNPKVVTTLLFSESVGNQAGKDGNDAVAVTFAYGKGVSTEMAADPVATGGAPIQNRDKMTGGRVLHVLSHFGKQGGDDAGSNGEATLLNLMVNFLSEAAMRRKLQGKKG